MFRHPYLSALALIVLAVPTLAAEPRAARIDAAIDKIKARELRADTHTPWAIMHAAIAFEKDLTVTRADGTKVNAIEFLLNEAKDGDGPMYRTDLAGRGDGGEGADPTVPRIRTRDTTPGFKQSFILQDHVDQFLFCYADAGVALDTPGKLDAGAFTVQTLLDAALREFKPTQELGWTLVVTSTYLPIDATWLTIDGKQMRTADIMALAVKRDVNRETEGGPHHLYGVAYALERYRAAHPDKELDGPWAAARAYLDKHVTLAQELQNDDGSFSSAMFRGQQIARSPQHMVWATGHTLEWLTLALTAEELTADWVTRAVDQLAAVIERTPLDALSEGGMTHAAHALVRYREKVGR